jgi:hypothetical protein
MNSQHLNQQRVGAGVVPLRQRFTYLRAVACALLASFPLLILSAKAWSLKTQGSLCVVRETSRCLQKTTAGLTYPPRLYSGACGFTAAGVQSPAPAIPPTNGGAPNSGSSLAGAPGARSWSTQWFDSLEGRRFAALADLETGSRDDLPPGAAGEVSRFAVVPAVWRKYPRLPLSSARNPFTALNVARAVMEDRISRFAHRHGRQPTDAEWSMLWHAPNRSRWTPSDRDYSRRFSNLMARRAR